MEKGSEACEVVQLHGSLAILRCALCHVIRTWEGGLNEMDFLEGTAPSCDKCVARDLRRQVQGRRRITVGRLRPDIVLYGETHPDSDAMASIMNYDLALVDTVLIMGTSLSVYGIKDLVKQLAKAAHARNGLRKNVILVNHSKPGDSEWDGVIDYWVSMPCDLWVQGLLNQEPVDASGLQCIDGRDREILNITANSDHRNHTESLRLIINEAEQSHQVWSALRRRAACLLEYTLQIGQYGVTATEVHIGHHTEDIPEPMLINTEETVRTHQSWIALRRRAACLLQHC